MITVDAIVNCVAVAYSAVKLLCTCKYIDHCLVTVFGIGEGGMGWRIKEGILDASRLERYRTSVLLACLTKVRR
jgi:hypothetical protein